MSVYWAQPSPLQCVYVHTSVKQWKEGDRVYDFSQYNMLTEPGPAMSVATVAANTAAAVPER